MIVTVFHCNCLLKDVCRSHIPYASCTKYEMNPKIYETPLISSERIQINYARVKTKSAFKVSGMEISKLEKLIGTIFFQNVNWFFYQEIRGGGNQQKHLKPIQP